MFLALVSILSSAALANPGPTTTIKDDAAIGLITALTAGGIKYNKVSAKLATVTAKNMACVSHSNTAFETNLPNWYIRTVACRTNIPKDDSAFGNKGKHLGEALAIGDAIDKAQPKIDDHDPDDGSYFSWDCAMGKCATAIMDIVCSIKLDVEGGSNRFFCDITPFSYE